ncbi:hypothetical protein ACIHDR_46570 [Nocardia sp. NPDC052278]|uniref:hypothetical protein n=1 Tax=unclassified Nocardia TaxID=2637762 RepID=UPI0036CC8B7C
MGSGRKLLRRVDPNGHAESWTYDGEGNLLTQSDRPCRQHHPIHPRCLGLLQDLGQWLGSLVWTGGPHGKRHNGDSRSEVEVVASAEACELNPAAAQALLRMIMDAADRRYGSNWCRIVVAGAPDRDSARW